MLDKESGGRVKEAKLWFGLARASGPPDTALETE